ncbi:hypothetical protein [Gilvimarinus algae]|uniref:Uncharacterized protein n=1 Tax=Gilvimarinus algae TaxID=3058037 RepID=A0ABT8TI82_9GAMM|nr:hypothetical protein [Gilvimarinus sp. SDUM040014]MDO3382391.1 hypothetical protein [Gilvimarinus sp. SDUM040014]
MKGILWADDDWGERMLGANARIRALDQSLIEVLWEVYSTPPHLSLSTLNAYHSMKLEGLDPRTANRASPLFDASRAAREGVSLLATLHSLAVLQVRSMVTPPLACGSWFTAAEVRTAALRWSHQLDREHELLLNEGRSEAFGALGNLSLAGEGLVPTRNAGAAQVMAFHFDLVASNPDRPLVRLFARWYAEMCLRSMGIHSCGIWGLGKVLVAGARDVYAWDKKAPSLQRAALHRSVLQVLGQMTAQLKWHLQRQARTP